MDHRAMSFAIGKDLVQGNMPIVHNAFLLMCQSAACLADNLEFSSTGG